MLTLETKLADSRIGPHTYRLDKVHFHFQWLKITLQKNVLHLGIFSSGITDNFVFIFIFQLRRLAHFVTWFPSIHGPCQFIGLLLLHLMIPYFFFSRWWLATSSLGWRCFLTNLVGLPTRLCGNHRHAVPAGAQCSYCCFWTTRPRNVVHSCYGMTTIRLS